MRNGNPHFDGRYPLMRKVATAHSGASQTPPGGNPEGERGCPTIPSG